jgi:hypothetical protein
MIRARATSCDTMGSKVMLHSASASRFPNLKIDLVTNQNFKRESATWWYGSRNLFRSGSEYRVTLDAAG